MVVHYQSNLIAKELFPEDTSSFRLNAINRDDWDHLAKHPDSIRLISSTGDVTIRPKSNLGLSNDLQSTYAPVESFKNSIKQDASILTALKDGEY